ncbi:MAG: hypothetical protein Q8936_13540 [Bacillota bacterium]|nr:hypothetical protein [Bacillota bacterium]
MQGIRAWDYEAGEYYIEDNFNYILAAVNDLGNIAVSEDDIMAGKLKDLEISDILALKSVQETSKKDDPYEISFREELFYNFYDLENPRKENGIKIYTVDNEKLADLVLTAKNQSMAIFLEEEEY